MFLLTGSDGRPGSEFILMQEWSKCFQIIEQVSRKELISRELILCVCKRICESQLHTLFIVQQCPLALFVFMEVKSDWCLKDWRSEHVQMFFDISLTMHLNIYLNINQLDALNFTTSLFHASTCFEHKCSSSGGQNCTIQSLVSSYL
jgi:hypothetical protein